MERIIAGRHLDVNDSIKEFINGELDKIESEYRKLTSTRVVLDIQKNWHITEIIIHGKKISIEATAKSKEIHTSIAGAVQKAKKQLKRYLDRVQDYHSNKDKNVKIPL